MYAYFFIKSKMRTLEKGFGNYSLRTSTYLCLFVLVVIGVIMVLGVFTNNFGFYEESFMGKVLTFIYQVPLTAVFGYTLYTLQQEESFMLRWAFGALCADVVITVLGLLVSIVTFFTHLFSLIISLFVLIPLTAFKAYSAWILYSYWIEFRPPVSVTA